MESLRRGRVQATRLAVVDTVIVGQSRFSRSRLRAYGEADSCVGRARSRLGEAAAFKLVKYVAVTASDIQSSRDHNLRRDNTGRVQIKPRTTIVVNNALKSLHRDTCVSVLRFGTLLMHSRARRYLEISRDDDLLFST